MIIATAGYIDHGKTTLVKALTGVDTDRLPEKMRKRYLVGGTTTGIPCSGFFAHVRLVSANIR